MFASMAVRRCNGVVGVVLLARDSKARRRRYIQDRLEDRDLARHRRL